MLARIRGILLVIALIIAILAHRVRDREPGGIAVRRHLARSRDLLGPSCSWWWCIGVLAVFGRRRQKRAQAERAEQIGSSRSR